MMKRLICLLSASCILANASMAQPSPALSKEQRMEWWRDARFGMFIHWGVYAVPAGTWKGRKINRIGEWIMNRGKIPVADYQKFAQDFNPVKYDADAWVRLAKEAGMKYIVITAKHHDGFALFDSKASKWDIVDASPYGKDLLKPLAAACRKYGVKLGFYYSHAQDWNNPGGAAARKVASEGWANPDSARIDAYTAANKGHWDPAQTTKTMAQYMDEVAVPQVKELLTNYGDVAVLWWDTPTDMTDEFATKLNEQLKLQPHIITNDRLKRPNFAGDYTTPEQRIPKVGEMDGKDWETCMTMNGSWGYKSYDSAWKPATTLVQNLIDIASKGGNYLLNIGPKADGSIPRESIERLQQVGAWMKVNGEAIYGTTGSPLKPQAWGRITKKENNGNTILYLSVFEWPANGKLEVPGIKNKVVSAKLLSNGNTVKTSSTGDVLSLTLPAGPTDKIASVIKVELKGNL